MSTLSYNSLSTRTYTGKAIKPSITVKYGKTTLKNGRDYTLSYGKNVATGKGTVKISGKATIVEQSLEALKSYRKNQV